MNDQLKQLLEGRYTIAPIEWRQNNPEWYEATTIFGIIHVEKDASGWLWRYCFDEIYDEDFGHCDTMEESQAHIEKIVMNRLLPALRPVRSPSDDRGNIGDIIGKWPGDETDEQIQKALEELS